MSERAIAGEGVSARVLREIVRTPAFNEILKLHLNAPPPHAAADVVHVALAEDANLSLSAVATCPQRINNFVAALLAATKEVERISPEMFAQFTTGLVAEIDREQLRALPGAVAPLLARWRPDPAWCAEAINRAVVRMDDSMVRDGQWWHELAERLAGRALWSATWKLIKAAVRGMWRGRR